ncbi:MAG: hypothetical protein ACQEVA_22400 [Myxococcota bacterium]
MVRKRLLTLMALALAASLALLGCNDDPGENNNGNNGTDAGMDVEEDTTEGDTESDTEDGCTSDADCAPGVCNMSTGMCEAPATDEGCDADPRPARCDEDPTTTEYDPASVISSLAIAGWEDANEDGQFQADEFNEDACCFDFDGDGENDNGLGGLLADFGSVLGLNLAEANVELQTAIDEGSLIIVFEHQGLEDLTGDEFEINFLLGELDGVASITTDGSATNPVLIDPTSFDEGSYPQARIPDAELESDGVVTAGPGNARLQLDLLGATIDLAIRQAQITTQVPDTPESDLADKGVFLTEGKLGGFTTVADLFDALNTFTGNCECLGLADGENLIDYDPNDPLNPETTSCNENADAGACEGTDDTCFQIADNCGLVVSVGPGLADLDTDGDGAVDSISIGLEFTAAGADISGVATAE